MFGKYNLPILHGQSIQLHFQFICFNQTPLKTFLKCFNFCPDFFRLVRKRLDEKDKVNFKMYDITTWERNNYNTHIT